MEKRDLIEKIKKIMPFICHKYPIKKIGIFGSVARNEEKEDSDLDILVEFNNPIGFFDFIRLEKELSELLNKKVDLVSKKALKPSIKDEIIKETIYV